MKFIFLSLSILNFSLATSFDITCEYTTEDFSSVTNQFSCRVTNIARTSIFISDVTSLSGFNPRPSNDVTAFTSTSHALPEIPSNLSNFFPSLLALKINSAGLEQVRQVDISSWSNLKYLNLDKNEIESLENSLFANNRELVVIYLADNKIKFIESKVFDVVGKLNVLDLRNNKCVTDMRQSGPKTGFFNKKDPLQKFIEDVRGKCGTSGKKEEAMKSKLQKFEDKIAKLKSNGSLEVGKVEKLEKIVENCTDVEYNLKSEIFPLNTKIANLKIEKESCRVKNEILIEESRESETKVKNLEEKVENLTKTFEECFNENLTEIQSKFDLEVFKVHQLSIELEKFQFSALENETNFEKQILDLENENSELRDEISIKKLEIENFIQNSGNFSEIISQLNGEIYDKETKILDLEGNLTDTIIESEKNLRELKIKFDESMRKFDEDLSKCKTNLSKVKEAKVKVDAKFLESERNFKILDAELSNLTEAQKFQKLQISTLEWQKLNLENQMKLQSSEISSKNDQILELEVNVSKFEAKISSLSSQLFTFNSRSLNSNETNECEIRSQNLDESLKLLYDNFQQLEEKSKELEEEKKNLESENQNLTTKNQKIEILTENHQKILESFENLKNENENLKKNSSKVSSKLEIVMKENEKLQAEKSFEDAESLPVEVSALITENNELKMWNNLVLYIALPVCAFITILNMIIVAACLRKMASYKVENSKEILNNLNMDDMQREWVYGN